MPTMHFVLHARRLRQMPAERKLHGWSVDGTLLMREREREDKTDPLCPLMISLGGVDGLLQIPLLWFHVCQFAVVDQFD